MNEGTRVFLLSLVAVPACGEGNPGASFEVSCEKYLTKYQDCYEVMGGGGQPPPEYDVTMYCDYYESYFDMGGPQCRAAASEYWSCISNLDCDTFLGNREGACREAYENSHARCPTLFPFCQFVTVSAGGNQCGNTFNDCIDGKEYGVNCTDADDGNLQCECTVAGEVTKMLTEPGMCLSTSLDEIATRCDFPEAVTEPS